MHAHAAHAQRASCRAPFRAGGRPAASRIVVCSAQKAPETPPTSGRREVLLYSFASPAVLAALFTWGAAPRPNTLGIQQYGRDIKTLGLCPPTPNCVSTAEEINDPAHYIPAWQYNPQDGRGRKNPATQEQAMQELVDVVTSVRPDNFTPKIVQRTKDYLYVEFESPTFGFIDDFEAFFPPGERSIVEYRSASRIGESDGNINRKRIKAIRQALEKRGWASTAGY